MWGRGMSLPRRSISFRRGLCSGRLRFASLRVMKRRGKISIARRISSNAANRSFSVAESVMRRALGLLIVLLLSPPASAQTSSALINEQLDKQVKLNFAAKTPLPQIIQSIANDTGVRIEVTPDVYELLPWGEQTAIAAQIENQTLRQALEAITRTL